MPHTTRHVVLQPGSPTAGGGPDHHGHLDPVFVIEQRVQRICSVRRAACSGAPREACVWHTTWGFRGSPGRPTLLMEVCTVRRLAGQAQRGRRADHLVGARRSDPCGAAGSVQARHALIPAAAPSCPGPPPRGIPSVPSPHPHRERALPLSRALARARFSVRRADGASGWKGAGGARSRRHRSARASTASAWFRWMIPSHPPAT